ncbi:hypothetical protein FRB99_008261 [Tulasnella sp. 403]|nr:hypothetical protein FRB99_008261 [Tulasnella sp. 403]
MINHGEEGEIDEILGAEPDAPPVGSLRIEKTDLLYDETCRLGSGRFGTVYRARLRGVLGSAAEEVVAVKRLFREFDEAGRTNLEGSMQSWTPVRHPSILPFRGFCDDGGDVLLVYSYHPGGTLAEYLEKNSLTYARRMELSTEIAQGLLYLHTRDPPVWHGDLHLGNVFVSVDGHPLLSDWGIPATMDRKDNVGLSLTDDRWRYDSPEVMIKASRPTARSDVWSWSCLFLEIMTGKIPYESIPNVDSLSERALPAIAETLDCPARAQNIMGHCWKHDPELRPPMGEVLAILTGQGFRFEKVKDVAIKE